MRLTPGPKGPVEVESGADQGQVRESLREVTQSLAAWADLLRIQPQVVGVAEHLLEDEPGFIDPSRARQRLYKPERAQAERPFLSRKAVYRLLDVVTIHEAVGDQPVVFWRAVGGVQRA